MDRQSLKENLIQKFDLKPNQESKGIFGNALRARIVARLNNTTPKTQEKQRYMTEETRSIKSAARNLTIAPKPSTA